MSVKFWQFIPDILALLGTWVVFEKSVIKGFTHFDFTFKDGSEYIKKAIRDKKLAYFGLFLIVLSTVIHILLTAYS